MCGLKRSKHTDSHNAGGEVASAVHGPAALSDRLASDTGDGRCVELAGLDVEFRRWQRLEACAVSHRTQLHGEAP